MEIYVGGHIFSNDHVVSYGHWPIRQSDPFVCIHVYSRVTTLPPSSTERAYQHQCTTTSTSSSEFDYGVQRLHRVRDHWTTSSTSSSEIDYGIQRLHRVPRRHLPADYMPRINRYACICALSREFSSILPLMCQSTTDNVRMPFDYYWALTQIWNERPLMALWCLFFCIFCRFIGWFLQDTRTYSSYEGLYMYTHVFHHTHILHNMMKPPFKGYGK